MATAEHPQQVTAPGPVGVGHEQQRERVVEVDVDALQVLADGQGVGPERGQGASRLGGRQQHRRQRGRGSPLGARRRGGQHVGAGAGEQVLAEPLAVAVAHPAARRQLVGVAGHARRRELVDVGEEQLGELRHRRRGQARLGRRLGQLAPRHPGPDAVCREQAVHRPSAPRLPPSERVGTFAGRAERGARVDVAAAAGELEEAGDRHLHGLLDRVAGRAAQGAACSRGPRRPPPPSSSSRWRGVARAGRAAPRRPSAGRRRPALWRCSL